MAQDKPRAILSFATPNPVGPYRLVTPLNQVQPQQTKTPILPVMGGTLINTMPPPLPTKQKTPVAPPIAGRLVNVPTPPMTDKLKSDSGPLDFLKKEQERVSRITIDDIVGIDVPKMPSRNTEAWSANMRRQYDDVKMYIRNNPTSPLAKAIPSENPTIKRGAWGRTDKEASENFGIAKALGELRALNSQGFSPRQAETLVPVYGHLVTRYDIGERGKPKTYDDLVKQTKTLNQAQLETFASLAPEWEGTMNELVDVARSLGG